MVFHKNSEIALKHPKKKILYVLILVEELSSMTLKVSNFIHPSMSVTLDLGCNYLQQSVLCFSEPCHHLMTNERDIYIFLYGSRADRKSLFHTTQYYVSLVDHMFDCYGRLPRSIAFLS